MRERDAADGAAGWRLWAQADGFRATRPSAEGCSGCAPVRESAGRRPPDGGSNRWGEAVQGQHPLEQEIGRRIRVRRLLLGVTQQELASRVDVTFQQIQKYERAENRVSAVMLVLIARALEVDVRHFLARAEDGEGDASSVPEPETGPGAEALRLAGLILQAPGPVREALSSLVTALAGSAPDDLRAPIA